jgi:hypothetical protein
MIPPFMVPKTYPSFTTVENDFWIVHVKKWRFTNVRSTTWDDGR